MGELFEGKWKKERTETPSASSRGQTESSADPASVTDLSEARKKKELVDKARLNHRSYGEEAAREEMYSAERERIEREIQEGKIRIGAEITDGQREALDEMLKLNPFDLNTGAPREINPETGLPLGISKEEGEMIRRKYGRRDAPDLGEDK